MSQAVFGADYAAAYDVLYHDKDYAAECDLIERVFAEYGDSNIQVVLDLRCGTGGHARLLTERGYTVVGVDRSPDMLRRARKRGTTARFELGDITSLDLRETFDAVLMMFAFLSVVPATSFDRAPRRCGAGARSTMRRVDTSPLQMLQ